MWPDEFTTRDTWLGGWKKDFTMSDANKVQGWGKGFVAPRPMGEGESAEQKAAPTPVLRPELRRTPGQTLHTGAPWASEPSV